jgi:hypothetical protein
MPVSTTAVLINMHGCALVCSICCQFPAHCTKQLLSPVLHAVTGLLARWCTLLLRSGATSKQKQEQPTVMLSMWWLVPVVAQVLLHALPLLTAVQNCLKMAEWMQHLQAAQPATPAAAPAAAEVVALVLLGQQ